MQKVRLVDNKLVTIVLMCTTLCTVCTKIPLAAIERHLITPFHKLNLTSWCYEWSDQIADYGFGVHAIADSTTHACQEKTIIAHWAWSEGCHRKVVRVNVPTYSQTSKVD